MAVALISTALFFNGLSGSEKVTGRVVADVEVEDEFQFERRWFGSNPEQSG